MTRGCDPADYNPFIRQITNPQLLKLLLNPTRYFLACSQDHGARLNAFTATSGPRGTGITWTVVRELLECARGGGSAFAVAPSNDLRNKYLKETIKQLEILQAGSAHRREWHFAHIVFVGSDDDEMLADGCGEITQLIEHVPYPSSTAENCNGSNPLMLFHERSISLR